jgi:hypothetical protein
MVEKGIWCIGGDGGEGRGRRRLERKKRTRNDDKNEKKNPLMDCISAYGRKSRPDDGISRNIFVVYPSPSRK